MTVTPYSDVNALLANLQSRIRAILGEKLVGAYLSGSLVTGDFNHDVSDVDLIVATSTDLDDQECARLAAMHEDVDREYPRWTGRIDVSYVPLAALRESSPGQRYPVKYPSEPFHWEAAGSDLMITRYILREKGVALVGPAPRTLVGPVSRDDLIEAVQQACREWREYVKDTRSRNGQAFAILSMCRALYTVIRGEFVSKRQAALWAKTSEPEWAPVIRQALAWWQDADLWRNGRIDHDETVPATRHFVNSAIDRVLGEERPPESP
ncbi:MAG: aminoglycoside adenylyltransferase domain-containing protein [Chloroflexota bacterium]